jgi:hypothetical protein
MSTNFNQLSSLNHFIPVDQASQMTQRHRDNKEKVIHTDFRSKDVLPLCETFNKQLFLQLCNQADCVGIRIYYGMDSDMKVHAIIVGVDANGADLLPAPSAANAKTDSGSGSGSGSGPGEEGVRCPPVCPTPSVLNGF